MRKAFFEAWRRYRAGEVLSAADHLIVEAARQHPEYQTVLADPERYHDHDWQPELGAVNPFLHLGLHIALREQVSLDRPPGIRAQYERLCQASQDRHAAEHRLIDCLAETLWQAERAGTLPDEQAYLRCARSLG